MLRIAICDDELLHCAYTAQMIERVPEYADAKIRQYTNPQELLADLNAQSFPADIAIVDVCMEQMNGIALAKQINALVPNCQIIFLSAYLKYATEVYAADHVYFVLKDGEPFYTGIAESRQQSALRLLADDSSEKRAFRSHPHFRG